MLPHVTLNYATWLLRTCLLVKFFFFFSPINLISIAQKGHFLFSSFSRFLMIYSRNLSYSPGQIRYLFLFLLAFVIVLYKDAAAAAAKSLQSCPTLCNPIDGSTPGSPVPGILQARTLEWVAISFSNALLITKNN